jgi:hypothetical protein
LAGVCSDSTELYDKLAVRGDGCDIYYIQPLTKKSHVPERHMAFFSSILKLAGNAD